MGMAMLMRMSRLFLVLLLVSSAAFGAGEKAYRIVLPDGTVQFSDKPQPGSTEIKVPPAQTYQALPVPALHMTTSQNGSASAAFKYDDLSIDSPAQDQTFHATGGTIPVHVTLSPALRVGDTLAILLDGGTVASGTGLGYTLQGVVRGSHTVVAEVLDAKGQTVQSSAPVTFYVHQHSKFLPEKKPKTSPKKPKPNTAS